MWGEVCWGVGMSKERCVGSGELWVGMWESGWLPVTSPHGNFATW